MKREEELTAMTPERATYFMKRFKSEEKMLGPNEQLALDFVIELLSTQRSEEELTVSVKALEWTLVDDGWWAAGSIIGGFEVRQSRVSTSVRLPTERLFSRFDGILDEAKAWCQSHLEESIRSAIVSSPKRGDTATEQARQACILLERACAYAGDAIPASILRDAQELHASLATQSIPLAEEHEKGIEAAIEAYEKSTGAEPHQTRGWIESALEDAIAAYRAALTAKPDTDGREVE